MIEEHYLVFGVIALTVVLFIWDKWRYDVVALTSLFISVVIGVVPAEKAFIGFSDPVVVTVAAVLIMSAAVGRSGFIDWVLKLMSGLIEKPSLQITLMVTLVMTLSAFMNNVGALAIFLPIAMSFAKKAGRSPSELLMPLAFGSLLGGLVTLIGTPPNLLISNIRRQITGQPFDMFDFAPVGIFICLAGIIYLSIAWRLIPKDRKSQTSAEDSFSIEDYIAEVTIGEDSKVIGKTIYEVEQNMDSDFAIVGLIRNGYHQLSPSGRLTLRDGDTLFLETDPVNLKKFVDTAKVDLAGSKELEEESAPDAKGNKKTAKLSSEEIGIFEAIIMAGSELDHATPYQLQLRSRFGVNLLAVRQKGKSHYKHLKHAQLREGDIVVLQGNHDSMPETLRELGCLPLAERNLQLGRPRRALLPIGIMAVAVALTVSGVLPISIAFLGGVLAIAFFKILKLSEIYEAIDWPILILLGAMMPVTQALQDSGGTEIIAESISAITKSLSSHAILAVIMIASMLITPFLNNAATVLLMAPIAATLATKLGLNVDAFLMAVAIGTSCDFLTPIGHQSNTLVMGPGGYKFNDYWKLGLPLSIIVVILGVPLISIFWPLS